MTGATSADPSPDKGSRRPSNRRQLILEAAVDLFHHNGYPATGVDDIGKAVNVSGPAIYRHFASKEEILLEAIKAAADEVHAANNAARASGAKSAVLLESFIRAYARVAIEQSALISVWTSEARHLNASRRSPMTKRLRAWRDEWVEVLQVVRPEITDDQAVILVSGAIGLITTLATSTSHDNEDDTDNLLEDRTVAMAMATLHTEIV